MSGWSSSPFSSRHEDGHEDGKGTLIGYSQRQESVRKTSKISVTLKGIEMEGQFTLRGRRVVLKGGVPCPVRAQGSVSPLAIELDTCREEE